MISKTKKLKIINLSASYLYDKFLPEIFNSLRNKKIIKLDLSSNFITSIGAKHISNWLKTNKTLKFLNLEQNTTNEFKRYGAECISEAVMLHPCLNHLSLSYMILTGSGEKIAQMLNTNKTLKTLKIRNTRMNFDDHIFIFGALELNDSLESLDFGENPSGVDKSVVNLSLFIEKNRSIKDINLDKYGISKKMQVVFLDSLKKNNYIEKIYLNDTKLGLKDVIEVLKEKNNIKEIYIVNNNKDLFYSEEEKKELDLYLEENIEIKVVISNDKK